MKDLLRTTHATRSPQLMVAVAFVVLVSGCASTRHQAPVESRVGAPRTVPPTAASTPAPTPVPAPEAPRPALGSENAGKPGYYTVKPGDTLNRIAAEQGLAARDIAKWNNVELTSVIEVGQVLRVVPPGTDPAAVAARGVATAKVEGRSLDAKAPPAAASAASAPAPAAAAAPAPAPAPALPPVASAEPPAARTADDDVKWMWPATGNVIGSFDESRTKGLAIGGKTGDPIYAAADGRVVYAGSGLRGYGNLVIVKHNNTYLTAYAHNQTLLVKEDQVVRRGQKIAEMGSSEAERVQLHFEIRRQGKPVDPAKLLPPR
jgi:lipoprotein NlpD